MNLSVFGGTGKTGQLLIQQAIATGHEVTVLARNPGKLQLDDQHLRVVQGDALDPDRVKQAVTGAGAVISLLGPSRDAPHLAVTLGTRNIIDAVRDCGGRRLIVTAGAGVGDPADRPGPVDKLLGLALKTFARDTYADVAQAAAAVRSSGLEWTLVRIARLTDEPATGRPKVGYLGKGAGLQLSRMDLAAFILQELADGRYIHQAPVVSS